MMTHEDLVSDFHRCHPPTVGKHQSGIIVHQNDCVRDDHIVANGDQFRIKTIQIAVVNIHPFGVLFTPSDQYQRKRATRSAMRRLSLFNMAGSLS